MADRYGGRRQIEMLPPSIKDYGHKKDYYELSLEEIEGRRERLQEECEALDGAKWD